MTRVLVDIGQTVGSLVPPWAIPIVIGVLAVVLLPAWLESVRSKQIKGAVRRMVRADPAERDRLYARAFGLAAQRRGRLVGLIQEGLRYGQHAVVHEGLARLQAIPRAREDVARLRERIDKPGQRFRDPVEAAVRIEGLLAQGLHVAAEEQLAEALTAFPRDPDLHSLQARLAR